SASAQQQQNRASTISPSRFFSYCFIAVMSTSATSGRENSGGGSSPFPNISRTLVPERLTCDSGPPGAVLAVPICPVTREKKAFSNLRGWIPNSPEANSSKIFCASYVP